MSAALFRQDLVPMLVGYLLIMGTLAIGLRIVHRSGKTEVGTAAGAGELTRAAKTAGTTQKAEADQVTGAAVATGAAGAGGRQPFGPAAGQVAGRARLRMLARPDPGWRRL